MLEPVGSGFRAKDIVLVASRFHEAMEAGLKRRLQQARKDVASANGKRRSAEKRIRRGLQRQVAMWRPRRAGMRLTAVRRPAHPDGGPALPPAERPAEMRRATSERWAPVFQAPDSSAEQAYSFLRGVVSAMATPGPPPPRRRRSSSPSGPRRRAAHQGPTVFPTSCGPGARRSSRR